MQIADFLASAATHVSLLSLEGAPDVTVFNCNAALAHSAARAFLSASWDIQAHSSTFQVTIDDFYWQSKQPCTILQHLGHPASTATTLRLPRGRHLLRVSVADPHVPHTISVWSTTPFLLSDRVPQLSDHQGLHFAEAYDHISEAPQAVWRVLCRHTFTLHAPCNVQIQLFAAPAATQRSLSLQIINNDTMHSQVLVLNRNHPRRMLPNSNGYTLVTIQDTSASSTPKGTYTLQVTSDAPVSELSPVPSSRCEKFCGDYRPNKLGTVCCYTICPLSPCSITVRIELQPTCLAGVLVLEEAGESHGTSAKSTAKSKGKGHEAIPAVTAEPPRIVFSAAVSAQETVPVVRVPPGPHVLSLTLNRHHSMFDLKPTGHIVTAATVLESKLPNMGSYHPACDTRGATDGMYGTHLIVQYVCVVLPWSHSWVVLLWLGLWP